MSYVSKACAHVHARVCMRVSAVPVPSLALHCTPGADRGFPNQELKKRLSRRLFSLFWAAVRERFYDPYNHPHDGGGNGDDGGVGGGSVGSVGLIVRAESAESSLFSPRAMCVRYFLRCSLWIGCGHCRHCRSHIAKNDSPRACGAGPRVLMRSDWVSGG